MSIFPSRANVLRTIVLVLFSCILTLPAYALPPQKKFMQLSSDTNGSLEALEVAVSDYQLTPTKTVSLVSAVHVADKAYYEKINRLLATYDVVLYELVAPRGVRPDPTLKRDGILNSIQEWFAKLVGASLQLDEVDYSPKNFLHADLSFQDLINEGKRRGETLFSFLAKVVSDAFAMEDAIGEMPNQPKTTAEVLEMYFNKHKRRQFLARTLAFLSKDSGMVGLKTLEPYLLEIRNKHVIKVLQKQMSKKKLHTIAIFYGAAHMNDLEQRMMRQFGVRHTNTKWLPAWDLATEYGVQF